MKSHKVKSIFVAAGAFLAFELLTVPYFSIAKLRAENPGLTALMRQRVHEAAGAGKTLTIVQRWVPLSRVSKNLIDAVIVAEDGAFYSHGGVDWFEVKESIEKNIDERCDQCYPLITATGSSLAIFRPIPSLWTTSTT